jgi:Flp pilus assembly pilin Flp
VSKNKGMNLLQKLRANLRVLHDDTAGAMSVEKILILALIAVPILIILLIFKGTIVDWFKTQSSDLQQQQQQQP